MFSIEVAGHVFSIRNRYKYCEYNCTDYITTKEAEYEITVTDDDIAKEKVFEQGQRDDYIENLVVYRKICNYLSDHDIVFFHCSALEIDGKALLFTAPSGTGKSTHARLWREYFGDRVRMVNDDKPLIYVGENEKIVYGTPYAGKERIQNNISSKIAGIVVLHQADENSIEKLSPKDAFPLLLGQTFYEKVPANALKAMELVKRLSNIPVYSLGCTISYEAVGLVAKTFDIHKED